MGKKNQGGGPLGINIHPSIRPRLACIRSRKYETCCGRGGEGKKEINLEQRK